MVAADARQARVRARWTPPPGPLPAGEAGDPTLVAGPGERLDALSGEWRIFQRLGGHRYSTDDLLTAWYGLSKAEEADLRVARAVDLGCGIGSILLLLAWRLPEARCDGVEAQEGSAALCDRSIRWNGAEARVEVHPRDLRDTEGLLPAGSFQLATGSPPYLRPGTAGVSPDAQRDQCRFERRGGVEGYLAAMARLLTDDGVGALVHTWPERGRIHAATREAGLLPWRSRPVLFREDRDPLIALYALRKAGSPWDHEIEPPLVIRRTDGERGIEWRAIREGMGFPP